MAAGHGAIQGRGNRGVADRIIELARHADRYRASRVARVGVTGIGTPPAQGKWIQCRGGMKGW